MSRYTDSLSPFSISTFGAEREEQLRPTLEGLKSDGTFEISGETRIISRGEEDAAKANLLLLRQRRAQGLMPPNKNDPALTMAQARAILHPEQTPLDKEPSKDSFVEKQPRQEQKLFDRRGTSSQPNIEEPKEGKYRGFFRKKGGDNAKK